jgi:VanZ family protein
MKTARLEEFKRLSKITIGLGAYIVISAAFMLQVRDWLFKVFGDLVIVTSFRLCFILIFLLMLIYAFRIRLGLFKICAIASIFVLGYLFSMWQQFFSEKTHVLTYGLLGYLASKDLVDTRSNSQLKNITLVAIYVSFISALDEIFQGILPYRFAEFKDFITNIISGVMGIALLFTLQNKRRFPG